MQPLYNRMVKDPHLRVSLEVIDRPITRGIDIASYQYDVLDYELTDVEKDIIDRVNRSHPQLGGMVLWDLVFATSRRIGTMKIACMGSGKSTSQRALKVGLKGIDIIPADGGLTPARIAELKMEDRFKRALVIIDDVTTLFVTQTGETTIELIGHLLEQGAWYGMSKQHPIIKDADIGCLMAGTPWALKVLVSTGLFRSHIKDRILRLYWFYHNFREYDDKGYRVTKSSPPNIEIEYKEMKDIPYDVSAEWENRCIDMLENQFSPNRATNAVRRLLRAHATVCGKDAVDDDDARWLYMYKPMITIESKFLFQPLSLEYGITTTGPLVYADIYPTILTWLSYKPSSIVDICKKLNLSAYLADEAISHLRDAGYIEEIENKYYLTGSLSQELEKFHEVMG